MRFILIGLLLVSSTAVADKKIVDMTPLYKKEAAACTSQLNGLVKVAAGAKTLSADPADKEQIARDLVQLEKAITTFEDYCKQTADMAAFLETNAKTAYKKVEREIGTRDNAIRKLRKDTKKLVVETSSCTRKLIPQITKQTTGNPPPPEEKRVPGKFPSGRVVELPTGMAGTWKLSGNAKLDTASYLDKAITATITTRVFTGTCDQQRKAIPAKPGDIAQLDLVGNSYAKGLDIAWALQYVRGEKTAPHLTMVTCVTRKTGGGLLATANIDPDNAPIVDDVTKLAIRMLQSLANAR